MLNQILNHLKMAIWHLREAKLAALRGKFIYMKGALDAIVCALAWLEGVLRDLSTGQTQFKITVKDEEGEEQKVARKAVKERYRRYTFDDDDAVIIKNPRYVSLGKDSDIIWDAYGIEHWIPKTWKQLEIEQLA